LTALNPSDTISLNWESEIAFMIEENTGSVLEDPGTDTGEITLAYPPDCESSYMFYALARQRIPSGEYEFSHNHLPMSELVDAARKQEFDICTVPVHLYPYIYLNYKPLNTGASVTQNGGPCVVARQRISKWALRGARVAVPSLYSTAYLCLKLFEYDFHAIPIDPDRIIEAVQYGKVRAGLLPHTHLPAIPESKLKKVIDLGLWWKSKTALPLPLRCLVIRRELSEKTQIEVTQLIKASIIYALEHREESLDYAINHFPWPGDDVAISYLNQFVNQYTRNLEQPGRESIRRMLELGWQSGFVPRALKLDFV
jgi:1,4-dihydroxy-6-naphthoate synthase